ncbi:Fructosamine kinase domain-containing protein [Neurospora intermedia]|uniref:protein-ribulosamine 3-kinase n=1 Tax=Neurospora intermedia TaxID=5142 RepID=A0ABR3DQR1_NEUIN
MEKREPLQAEPIGDNVQLDPVVVAKLPPNSKILSVTPSGKSFCVGTFKIVVELADGTTAQFFKKGARGSVGINMMKGTWEAENALYKFVPHYTPRPVGWGTYENDPDTSFYLCQFIDMHDRLPSPREWAEAVSSLHLISMGKSPTGQFGFPVVTHLANVPVDNTWNASWEAFWTQQMKGLFDQEARVNGPDDELEALKTTYMAEVIPRYLRPLETEGRSITPCLIHSDLWPGNIKRKTDSDDMKLCMFDACAYWGHNEADLGICRNPRYKLGQPCVQEYHKRVPISEPQADFDGRNAVYAMKYHALLSTMYKDRKFRQVLIEELKSLMNMAGAGRSTSDVALPPRL